MSYMRGPDLLREYVSTYLQTAVPAMLPIARAACGADQYSIPAPVRYDAYDPYEANDWPVMGMYVVSDRDHVHRDIDEYSQREYWSTYAVRLFVGVRTPFDSTGEYIQEFRFEETMKTRDRLTSVLKNVILNSPSLGGRDVEVLEETISTDYDAPSPINDKQRSILLAAAAVNVEIKMTEKLYLSELGTVDTASLEVEHVKIGESFD